ncbi:CLUMA_CG013534, isoform A [Clunio marinus]|uniref:CLUMA_CG013534, isoform A n=1 Tax=Clunio marinus TaxID=568069 RepID=A0A1J1IJ45_9DIPT|nr:CLUMA_CG013534, isoform A [Clunio marinus]
MPVEQWKAFKSEHGKNYSDEEDAKRFEIFKENLKLIEEHNMKYEKGETTYKMGLNKFSDWFQEEKQNLHGLKSPANNK